MIVSQTSAQFDFVTAYTGTQTGVWTVDGKEYSFTALEQLQGILDAVTATNQVQLLAALQAAGIQNMVIEVPVTTRRISKGSTSKGVGSFSLSDLPALMPEVHLPYSEKRSQSGLISSIPLQKLLYGLIHDILHRVSISPTRVFRQPSRAQPVQI